MEGARGAGARDEEYRAVADLRHALRVFVRASEELALARGVTARQHQLLLAVRGHPAYPAVSITEIAEVLQMRRNSASLLVERAVRRGLLERRRDQADRRRALVALTAEGQRVVEAVTVAHRAAWPPIARASARLRAAEGGAEARAR